MENIVTKALLFARKAHEGQKRKITGEDYINHPIRVAEIYTQVKESKHIDQICAAILLHDVVEDCDVTIQEIEKEFGSFVARLVEETTSDKEKIKIFGKKYYLSHKFLIISNYGLGIKLSDRDDNLTDLHLGTESFREKLLDETIHIVNILENFRILTPTHVKLINKIKKRINELS